MWRSILRVVALFLFMQRVQSETFTIELNGTPDTVQYDVGHSGTVTLVCKGPKVANLEWEFQGKPLLPLQKVIVTKNSLNLEMTKYSDVFDGLYACSDKDTADRKKVRLYHTEEPPMPSGYTACNAAQSKYCQKAKQCRVDGSDKISCLCVKGWGGQQCNDAIVEKAEVLQYKSRCALLMALTALLTGCIVLSILYVVRRTKHPSSDCIAFKRVPASPV